MPRWVVTFTVRLAVAMSIPQFRAKSWGSNCFPVAEERRDAMERANEWISNVGDVPDKDILGASSPRCKSLANECMLETEQSRRDGGDAPMRSPVSDR